MRAPDLVAAPGDHRLDIDAWDDLAESSGGSFFQSGTWAMAWWEHLAGRPETIIGVWTDAAGALEAVCALSRITQPLLRAGGPAVPVWVNTGSGTGAGDHLGWPVTNGLTPDVVAWMVNATNGPLALHSLDPTATGSLADHGFELVDTTATLRVPLGSGEHWFPGSPDFHKKLRYFERQLDKLGVSIGMVAADEISPELFRRLLELHAARAEGMGWGSSFDLERERFHRALIDRARSDRGPFACVARRDEEVVGVLYGFRFGSSFAYYQTGWSQDYMKQSLGSVLVTTTMAHAVANGATVFDFLRGDDAYKRRFGAAPSADETWALERGLAGAVVGLRRRAVGAIKGRKT